MSKNNDFNLSTLTYHHITKEKLKENTKKCVYYSLNLYERLKHTLSPTLKMIRRVLTLFKKCFRHICMFTKEYMNSLIHLWVCNWQLFSDIHINKLYNVSWLLSIDIVHKNEYIFLRVEFSNHFQNSLTNLMWVFVLPLLYLLSVFLQCKNTN